MRARDFASLVRESAGAWMEDSALRLSASLAFYSVFSLAPLLVIAVSIGALIFNEQTVRDQVAAQLEALAGPRAADALEALLVTTAAQQRTGAVAAIVGMLAMVFGASGVFGELKDALNTIWGVVVKPGRTWLRLIRDRFLTFSMILSIGFLLLVSLLLSAILTAVSKYMNWLLPLPAWVWQTFDLLGSLCVVTVLFAMIFKILPNVRIGWHDVGLRCSRVGSHCVALGLLFGLYFVFRRRIHEGLRLPVRLRHCSQSSRNALERSCARSAPYRASMTPAAISRGVGERNRTARQKVTIVPKQIHQGNSITGSQLG